MAGLAFQMSTGIQRFSGTEYVNPAHGTRRLCVRTGSGSNDVVKYGLTSDMSASKYCGMRMYMDGKYAYIGRSQTYTSSRSSQYDTTSSRSSQYDTTSSRSSQYDTTITGTLTHDSYLVNTTYPAQGAQGSYTSYIQNGATYYRSYSRFVGGGFSYSNSGSGALTKCSYGSSAGGGQVNGRSSPDSDVFDEGDVRGNVSGYHTYATYQYHTLSSAGMRSSYTEAAYTSQSYYATFYATYSKYTVASRTYTYEALTYYTHESYTYTDTVSTTSSRSSQYDTTSSRSSQYDTTSSRSNQYTSTSHNFNL